MPHKDWLEEPLETRHFLDAVSAVLVDSESVQCSMASSIAHDLNDVNVFWDLQGYAFTCLHT